MGIILYFIRESLRGFLQAKLMTFVSIMTIAVSLLVLGIAAMGAYLVRSAFQEESRTVDMEIFLTDRFAADDKAHNKLLAALRSRAEFSLVNYINKEGAWKRFVGVFGQTMLDAVDKNPLPASIELRLSPAAQTAQHAQRLAVELAQLPGVENVDFSRERFTRIEQIKGWANFGAVILIIICLLVLHFVVSNTVKLTIYARKDLVSTMRYVGATDTYIAMPFFIEGILQGCMGAVIGSTALWFCALMAKPFLGAMLPEMLIPVLIVMGVIFGWLGSASAVRKFLV